MELTGMEAISRGITAGLGGAIMPIILCSLSFLAGLVLGKWVGQYG